MSTTRELPRRALFLLQLALKEQLSRLRAVRNEFRTLHQSVRFVLDATERVSGSASASETEHLEATLAIDLARLTVTERDLELDIQIVQCVQQGAPPGPPAPPVASRDEREWERALRGLRGLLRAHPRGLVRVLHERRVGAGPRSTLTAEQARSEEITYARMGLISVERARRIWRGEAGPERDEERTLASLLRPGGEARTIDQINALLDQVNDTTHLHSVTRTERLLEQLSGETTGASLYGLPPFAELLSRLGRHSSDITLTTQMLGTAQRALHHLFETLPPGFPPLPRAHKPEYAYTYRTVLDLLDLCMETASEHLHWLKGERPPTSPALRYPVTTAPPIIAYSAIPGATAAVQEDRIVIDAPLQALCAPRLLVDVLHEAGHTQLPHDEALFNRGKLHPAVAVHARVLKHELEAASPDARNQLSAHIVELLADVVALSSGGPFFAVQRLLDGLSKSRWRPGVQLGFDPLVRAQALLQGCWMAWGARGPSGEPISAEHAAAAYTTVSRDRGWQRADTTNPVVQQGDVYLLGFLTAACAELYAAYQAELEARCEPTEQGGTAKTRAEAAAILAYTRAAKPMAVFVARCLLHVAEQGRDSIVFRNAPPGPLAPLADCVRECFHQDLKRMVQEAHPQVEPPYEFPPIALQLAARPQDLRQVASDEQHKRLVSQNALHLAWQGWLGAQVEDHLHGRHHLVSWQELSEVTMLTHLRWLADAGQSPTAWHKFPRLVESCAIAGVDAHWRPSQSHATRAWLCPYDEQSDALWMHGIGVIDLLRHQHVPRLAMLSEDQDAPSTDGVLGDISYARYLDYEFLDPAHFHHERHHPSPQPEPARPHPWARRLFSGAPEVAGGYDAPVFVVGVHAKIGGSEGGATSVQQVEVTQRLIHGLLYRAPPRRPPKHTRPTSRRGKPDSRQLTLVAVTRALAWADYAIWLEPTAHPLGAYRDLLHALQQLHQKHSPLHTETTTALRWTRLMQALRVHFFGPNDRASTAQALTTAIATWVEVCTPIGEPNTDANRLVLSFRIWRQRTRPSLQHTPIPNLTRLLEQFDRYLQVRCKPGLGGVDFVGRVSFRDFTVDAAALKTTLGLERDVNPGIAAQAMVACTYLLITWSILKQLRGYELITFVNVRDNELALDQP